MEKLINSLKKLGLSRYEAQAYIGLNKIITGQANEIAEISILEYMILPDEDIYEEEFQKGVKLAKLIKGK